MNQYVVTRMHGRIFSFLLCDGKAAEIHCDEEAAGTILGNIYIGRVKNIAQQLGAAFVEISPGQVCYLQLSDLKHPIYTRKGSSPKLQAGDELLVQVSRESLKSKYPSVTAGLTLHGKYMLLTTGNLQRSVSSKLKQPEKERLLQWLADMEADQNASDEAQGAARTASAERPPEASCGWLLRTNAGDASAKLLERDFLRLKEAYAGLLQYAVHRTCFSCLHQMPEAWLKRLSDLYDHETERILTDDPALYEKIRQYLSLYQKEDLPKLTLYENDLLPMGKLYSLEHQLEQALAERVWLKSGGYLVIQPTEALTAIDVNTGKYEGKKNREAAFLKINLEAAAEAARQIRLRNLSGIIIIDFINMEEETSVSLLLSALREHLRKDPVQTTLVDLTKLSLVEITRKKTEKTLAERV